MKLHLIFSLLMISGLAMAQVTADGDSPTEGSGSSSSVGSTGTGEEREPGDDGGFSDGEDVVISRPGPEPAPETSPEEEELIAYRAELAERVEAGELTWDEAQELFEELALSLGLGRDPDDVIDIDIDEIDERERLLEDFIEELDSQVQSGALSPDEAEAELIDFMIELGLLETIDGGRPVEPAEPRPMPQVDPETSLLRFEEMLGFLAENKALTTEQVREQVTAFAEFLEDGEDVEILPHPDMNLSMDQAELVYLARDFSIWYATDEFEVKDLQKELLQIAMSLGIIEGGDTIPVDPEPKPAPETPLERPRPMPEEYEPTPAELEMMELFYELAVLIEQGKMTPDEAWERLAEVAGDEGWDIPFDAPDTGAPEPVSERDAADSTILLALRSNLASRVDDDGLSSSKAWDELTQAFDSQEEATADGQGTAIRASSWGAVKAAIR